MNSLLDSTYQEFLQEVKIFLPASRCFTDPLKTLAFGTDASFYRLVPKIVLKVQTRDEVIRILKIAHRLKVPVTFRSAGTSLSGQALSDSVLLVQAGAWRVCRILDNGERIAIEPGVIGAEANALLLPYGKKIGPDPASINAAMVGGIAANNASGMCCGTAENSYKTVDHLKLVFHDGAYLDTADPASCAAFLGTHQELVREIVAIRDEIQANPLLRQRIADKFKIKNTTGYGINSFVDFNDPIDIIKHLMIGSEGTLAFIAEVTYKTVVEHAHKASPHHLSDRGGRMQCNDYSAQRRSARRSGADGLRVAQIRCGQARDAVVPQDARRSGRCPAGRDPRRGQRCAGQEDR